MPGACSFRGCHRVATTGRWCDECRIRERQRKRQRRAWHRERMRMHRAMAREDMPASVIEQALRRLDAARNLRRWTSE
ncbi:MAG TPA: hypothetical protein VG538_05970 [Vicinamibacterales bacterium]|jgi:hypothetical protein|nr:hypothetical protein [Vicinamibacterales bacterium]